MYWRDRENEAYKNDARGTVCHMLKLAVPFAPKIFEVAMQTINTEDRVFQGYTALPGLA